MIDVRQDIAILVLLTSNQTPLEVAWTYHNTPDLS